MTTAPMPDGSRRDGPRSDPYGPEGYGRDGYGSDRYPPEAPRPVRPRPTRPQVDAGKLWPGGIATAVVAGLVALVGVLVCRWLFGIPLLAPKSDGAYGDVHTTALVLLAAAAALVATALAHLLLLSTPRPLTFFGWIIGLATVLAVLLPFSTSAPLTAKIATAVVDLFLGVAIGSLISGVAARSVRIPPGVGPGYLGGNPSMYDERPRASGLS
jgi:Family of unknown function (DUF6069)